MYDFQITESGCIVRNANGDIVVMADTEEEARDYMQNASTFSTESWVEKSERYISPYDQFDNYTQKLKGKCWIDGKFGSIYEDQLNRFAKSFQKNTDFRVYIDCQYLGGEWIFLVDRVE